MSYTAGSLELSVLGISNASVANIDNAAKALRRLASSVEKVNMQQFVFAGDKLEVLFSKIAKATNSINTENISNLAAAAKSLNSISRIGNLEKMDFAKIGQGFSDLTVAITPFVDKVKEAEKSLVALDGVLKKSGGKKTDGIFSGDKNGKTLFNVAKLGITLHTMRRIGREAANIVQAGSDYTEALNLWQVAMRENLDLADKFVNKMNKAYGISTKNLMTAQATFKNMIGSLGQISDEVAYQLSEALVLMSADYASLYNRTLESAIQNMQSMLAGQVRPIRSAGLDMTESTLFMFYQQLGGTKTMRQLNRTEKQLLSILAVYKQMGRAGALGDMTKTLNTYANQSRMLAEYWAELKAWSGLLLKDWIDQNKILVRINAALIFMTEIVKAIAKARGLGEENFIDGIFETAEATNDEIDELQGKLLDFDKFRSLEGTSAATPFTIDDKLINAIAGYQSQIDNAINAAQELANEWLEAFGFTRDLNGDLIITEEKLAAIEKTIKSIATILGTIVALPFIIKFLQTGASTISSIVTVVKDLGVVLAGTGQATTLLGKAFTLLLAHPIVALIAGIVAGLTLLYFTNENVRNSINNLFNSLTPLLELVFGLVFDLINPLIDTLGILLNISGKIIAVVVDITTVLLDTINLVLIPFSYIVETILKTIETILVLLNSLLSFNFKGLGGKLGNIWGNWQSKKFAGSVLFTGAENFSNFVGTSSYEDTKVSETARSIGTSNIGYSSNTTSNGVNSRQMEQAFYNALIRYGESNSDKPIEVYLDGEKVYENTTAKAKARGKVWAKA